MKRTKRSIARGRPEELIAYCGLFCGDCPRYGGRMSGLARELRKEIEGSGLRRAARTERARRGAYKSFDNFWQMLGTIADFECPGCRKAGCSVTCRIRPCCRKRRLTGCWECPDFVTCPEFRGLRAVHGRGIAHNLRVLSRNGPRAFLRGRRYWLRQLKTGV